MSQNFCANFEHVPVKGKTQTKYYWPCCLSKCPLQLGQSHVRCDYAVYDYLGKFHGLRSLVGYSPWGRKESDTTEQLHFLSGSKHINKTMVNLILLKKSVLTYFMESVRLCVKFIDSIVL